MNAEEFALRVNPARRSGDGWVARCPAHEDRNPSLSIREQNGKVLLHCHAGCTVEDICSAVGLGLGDLFTRANPTRKINAVYGYLDEVGELLFEVVRYAPKDFRQRRPDGRGGWQWNLKGMRRVLYRLPEVVSATSVLVVEGEKDCETARSLGLVATCNPGGAGKWRDEYSESLPGKRICIIPDADEPGRQHGEQVARSLYGKTSSLKLLELPGAKDLTEWVGNGVTGEAEEVRERYARAREALLELVRNAPEWKLERFDGAGLLDKVAGFIRRFVSLSEAQVVAVALWAVHTHTFSTAECTPYLAITSAEKESGKTRLLEVLKNLALNPWLTGRVTAAVLVRKIDRDTPTLLLDEGDTAFGSEKEYAEALRGVLNTGYRRDGKASCCVGQGANITFRDFSTFCPKAIAGIGELPDTVASRSVPIRLKRAKRSEGVERFRRDKETEASNLREQVAAWSGSLIDRLRGARPELPDALTDRQQDVVEPLLAIADAAGGDWPRSARRSFVELCAQAHADNQSIGEQLLADIKQIFEMCDVDRISSSDLAAELAGIDTSPWGEWGKASKPITAAKLARLLGRYGITPHTVRIRDKTPKGYTLDDFADAFERHLRIPSPALSAPQCATVQRAGAKVPENLELCADGCDLSKCNAGAGVGTEAGKKTNKDGPRGVVALLLPSTGTDEDEVVV
jgi:hypothetical protein